MSAIITKILTSLAFAAIEKAYQWMVQKKLEQAETKAKALEASLQSMADKQVNEKKIEQVQEKVAAKWAEKDDLQKKYDFIKSLQEARAAASNSGESK